MPLFRFSNQNAVQRIAPEMFRLERQLQRLAEANLEEMFGVRFVASEFVIRGEQPGRIDTIGLDQDGSPTIIEYKRAENENVINQGLYYVNWLDEHRGDFELAAQKRLGTVEISWSHIRLIIIAQKYAKWDTFAVKQMGEGIELWRYVVYGDDLLYLELVFGQPQSATTARDGVSQSSASRDIAVQNSSEDVEEVYSLDDHLKKGSEKTQQIFDQIRDGILALALDEGEILETPNKLYIAYRHGRNFCEIEVQNKALKITLDILLSALNDPEKIARDVSNVGHWGTGDIQFKLDATDYVDYALSLISQAYQQTQ